MSKWMICNKNITSECLRQGILLRTLRNSVSGYLLPAIFRHCSSLYSTEMHYYILRPTFTNY